MKTLANFTYMLCILFASLAFTSCEKTDTDSDSPSSYNYPTDIATESLAIPKDNWYIKDDYMEALFPSQLFTKNTKYEYIKVYQRVKKAGTQSYCWEELPTDDTYFNIREFRIYIQKLGAIEEDYYQFLIEIKLKN